MGERRRSLTITTTPFSVPTWQSVVVHEEDTRVRKVKTPIDLTSDVTLAGKEGRLLAATHRQEGKEIDHPYAIGSTVATEYTYPCEPSAGLIFPPRLGTPAIEYRFSHVPPSDLSIFYEAPKDENLRYPCLVRTAADGLFFVAPVRGDGTQIVQLIDAGEGMMEGIIRAHVLYHVYGMLERPEWNGALAEVLPYLIDTPQMASVRMEHVTRWQFKSSRTRPLYA